jgi:chloride channel 3/4/5
MAGDSEENGQASGRGASEANERTSLLHPPLSATNGDSRRRSIRSAADEESINSFFSKEELALSTTAIGERLPYNSYSTIDWFHDLVKDSFRYRSIHQQRGWRGQALAVWDSSQGWVAAAMIGALTACVAFVVDISVAIVSDWKLGRCSSSIWQEREACEGGWIGWGSWGAEYGYFILFALGYAVISSSLTMLTKAELPSATILPHTEGMQSIQEKAKVMYMASGSGIPEIKTILSGFVIKGFLGFRVLLVKAIGAIFAVSAGLCLGKEGPFVHISTCVGYLVGRLFEKYRDNDRKMRELLSAACASGLSVAFGAPIGGVLFAYEEIATYFPRKVMWRAFLCSLVAAIVLRALNPTGTGKLVLFEARYGDAGRYEAIHYLVFIFLGVAGGVWGGLFCKLNFLWTKTFRSLSLIKNNPVLEVAIVAIVSAIIQFPNPLTREAGDGTIKLLLADCSSAPGNATWVCQNEDFSESAHYVGWLVHGTLAKLILTIITFGCKVPSGIIIPALDGGAFFGRLVGQLVPSLPPGIFAMVGAAAFLAGVSRMTISLCVVMFELTGSLEYIVPHMIAILTAKWVADALEKEGVYDLAQSVLGHPFLDEDACLAIVKDTDHAPQVQDLIPPPQTMAEITLIVNKDGVITRRILQEKLVLLQRRGLMDAGLVLVRERNLVGYFPQGEIEFALNELSQKEQRLQLLLPHFESMTTIEEQDEDQDVDVASGILDLTNFVDRTPLSVVDTAPIEFAISMFAKLGLRYLCITREGTGELRGVVIKKRLVAWLEKQKGHS